MAGAVMMRIVLDDQGVAALDRIATIAEQLTDQQSWNPIARELKRQTIILKEHARLEGDKPCR